MLVEPQINNEKPGCHHEIVKVAHARRLLGVYGGVKDHPWYVEWAEAIVRLADALEAAGVSADMVEVIVAGPPNA